MKLSREQHSDLNELAMQFGKIEVIAEELGIEVDSLAENGQANVTPPDVNLKPVLHALTSGRRQILLKAYQQKNAPASSIVNLSVMVNEDRFSC